MDYRLDEWATLYESADASSDEIGAPLVTGSLRELVAFAVSMEDERRESARIITGSLAGFDHDRIRAIARAEGLRGQAVID